MCWDIRGQPVATRTVESAASPVTLGGRDGPCALAIVKRSEKFHNMMEFMTLCYSVPGFSYRCYVTLLKQHFKGGNWLKCKTVRYVDFFKA